MKRFAVVLALAVAGCASKPAEPIVRIVREEVPVYRPCVPPDTPPAPVFLDGKDALVSLGKDAADQRYHLTSTEWFRKEARLSLLEKIVALCR